MLSVAFVIFVAIDHGVFLRCPYCKKIGSWRFDKLAAAVQEKDEYDYIVKSTQKLRCRVCKQEVIGVWSDSDGRSFKRKE